MIPDWDKYWVSQYGRVRRGRKIMRSVLTGHKNSKAGQRMTVILSQEGKSKTESVARLVLLAFVGRCPEGQQARHLDDIPWHNGLPNLKWGTPLENSRDALRNKRLRYTNVMKGEDQPNSKLTEKDVRLIRREYKPGKGGFGFIKLGKKYRVHSTTISNIITRETWKHVI